MNMIAIIVDSKLILPMKEMRLLIVIIASVDTYIVSEKEFYLTFFGLLVRKWKQWEKKWMKMKTKNQPNPNGKAFTSRSIKICIRFWSAYPMK